MTIVSLILTLIVIINGVFFIRFLIDLFKHKYDLYELPKANFLLALSSFIIFFFSALGISDFATSAVFYRMKKWVSDKKLPGTLNTQCVIPVAIMALAFITAINVDIKTLIVCIFAQVFGAYISPRFVVKMSSHAIKKCVSIGLIIAPLFILVGKLNLIPLTGTAVGLSGVKLFIAAICLSVFGALNNIGIGSYPLTMTLVYLLGMNPVIAFPIMMGASTFSAPIGSIQFIRYEQYNRKITLFTSTFGAVGALLGVSLIKGINIDTLQWIIAAILLYSGISNWIDLKN